MSKPLTFDDVKRIALMFPVPATDTSIYAWTPFGYAHELGHLLVSTKRQQARPRYGLSEDFDRAGRTSRVHEIAATIVHAWIAVPCIRARVRRRALWATLRDGVAPYARDHRREFTQPDWWHEPALWRAARRLIAERGVTPGAVQTVDGLTRLCRRAIGETTRRKR